MMAFATVAFPSVRTYEGRIVFNVVMPDGLIVTVTCSRSEALALADGLHDSSEGVKAP